MSSLGRPKWEPQPSTFNQIEELASKGLTQEQIAGAIGIASSTFFERKKEFPEISEAIERGKAKGIEVVASALMNKITEGDLQAIKFYLSRRAGWVEHQRPLAPLPSEEDNSQGSLKVNFSRPPKEGELF